MIIEIEKDIRQLTDRGYARETAIQYLEYLGTRIPLDGDGKWVIIHPDTGEIIDRIDPLY